MTSMEMVKLEMQFRDLKEEIEREIQDIWVILYTLDDIYEDRLRDSKSIAISHALQDSLTELVNKINSIETVYIKTGFESRMFKCEQMKANIVEFMVFIQENY